MKEYKLSIKVGDLVEVGRFRNVQTKIKSIEININICNEVKNYLN